MTSDSNPSDPNPLPDTTAAVAHASITLGADLVRDHWGVPHIRSDSLYDLCFAQGYATAQDRLWQMDYDRKRALGRAGEYLGATSRAQDALMRRRGFGAVSRADYDVCSPDAKTALDAYADGVNAFIDGDDPLPFEYGLLQTAPEPWQPWHGILVYKVRNSAEGGFRSKLFNAKLAMRLGAERVAELMPGYLPGMFLTVPPNTEYAPAGAVQNAVEELSQVVAACELLSEIDFGSNGWAVSGALTESGLPMVGGDSHRELEMPNVYYQTHLTHPDFDVLGHAIPGMPLVMHFAHNQHVAWGMTHGGCDTQDLFVEQLRRAPNGNGNGDSERVEYLFKGDWLQAESTTETLTSADAEDGDASGAQSTHTIEVVRTHHGPIIAGSPDAGVGIALSDPGSGEPTAWVDATLAAMRARNADEFEHALAEWTDRVNNYPYADVHGNFGYCLKGRVPIRSFVNAWGPVPGWTGDHEWQGYIPAADLPRSRNPDVGWVVTCNQRVVGDDYAHWLAATFGADYRARRIISHLQAYAESGDKMSVGDMAKFHADSVSIPAQQLQEWIGSIPANPDADGESVAALIEIGNWDADMTTDSDPAAVYKLAVNDLALKLISSCYGEVGQESFLEAYDHYRRNVKPWFFAELAAGGDCSKWFQPHGETQTVDDLLMDIIYDAGQRWLAMRDGDADAPAWGEMHITRQRHPLSSRFPQHADSLDAPAVGTAGDEDVPYATGSSPLADGITKSGPVNRYLHDPSDWSRGKWVVPLGASGNVGSPHRTDQQQLWASVGYIQQLYDWADIVRSASSSQRFEPPA